MGELQNLREGLEKIDNFALVVGLYNQDSCILVANFFKINMLTGCTEDMRI